MTNQLKRLLSVCHTLQLKIIQYAEERGNRPAARHFGIFYLKFFLNICAR